MGAELFWRVDEGAVHPALHALRELGDLFGCRGSSSVAMTMPFFRSDAPSRVKTIVPPSGVVMMSLTRRVLVTIESVTTGFAGSEMSIAYIRSPPAPYRDTPPCRRGVPRLLGAERRARKPPDNRGGRRTSRGTRVTDASAAASRTTRDGVGTGS